ncbi:hypothetical protein [Pandoraea capi]|uniref:hypothetical protein n=1 Tax=Pandoraea capi TaxID=2508286 RepID=UPI0012403E6A|nr:hypothetical protein [Pandoraea capi]
MKQGGHEGHQTFRVAANDRGHVIVAIDRRRFLQCLHGLSEAIGHIALVVVAMQPDDFERCEQHGGLAQILLLHGEQTVRVDVDRWT